MWIDLTCGRLLTTSCCSRCRPDRDHLPYSDRIHSDLAVDSTFVQACTIYIVRREVIVYCCTDGMQLVSHCVGDMTSIGCFFLFFQSRAQDPSQFIIIPGQIESQILSTMVDSEHCALYRPIYVGVSKASGSGTPKALKTSVCLQCWWWSVVTWSRKNKTIKLWLLLTANIRI